jgi:hypothetical protein
MFSALKKPRFPGAKILHCTLISKGIKPIIANYFMIRIAAWKCIAFMIYKKKAPQDF